MPNDTAITRLLYAILSQKCLKDIDWNKVAHDPVLSQEITNGHAARMRYSRFKKQMDGTTSDAIRRPRNQNSSRKNNKVEKKSSVKSVKKRVKTEGDDVARIKVENDGNSEVEELLGGGMVKREPVESSYVSRSPFTPNSYTSAPSPSHSHSHSQHSFGAIGEMGDMTTSFGGVGDDSYPSMILPAYTAGVDMSMSMQMGVNRGYDNSWDHYSQEDRSVGSRADSQMIGESGVLVKTEPRWEEAYRNV